MKVSPNHGEFNPIGGIPFMGYSKRDKGENERPTTHDWQSIQLGDCLGGQSHTIAIQLPLEHADYEKWS